MEKQSLKYRIKNLIYGDTMNVKTIINKQDLKEYLEQDAKANYRHSIKPRKSGDEIWKFIRCLRYLQYYDAARKTNKFIYIPFIIKRRYFHKLAMKLGFSISWTTYIGKGFSLPHYGSIVINPSAIIGENFKCHVGVNIGATNGRPEVARIGNNVYAGPGVKIVGDIDIADNVVLAANAVIVKSIDEPGTTWGGVPAKKSSENDSSVHLSHLLNIQ